MSRSALSATPGRPAADASYFLSHGGSGDWFIVQEPFRRRQVESLRRRRVLLVQVGGEHYLPSIYLVSDVRPHGDDGRYAVTVQGTDQYAEDFMHTDLLRQVPGSTYLVSAV